jgi:hypothetical protein
MPAGFAGSAVMFTSAEKNPTKIRNEFGNLFINRLVPGNGSFHIEWSCNEGYTCKNDEYLIRIYELESDIDVPVAPMQSDFLYSFDSQLQESEISGLCNGIDYVVSLSKYRNGKKIAQAPVRLIRPCPAPGVTVAYNHPEDFTFATSGCYLCSPTILRLPEGRLILGHDFYSPKGGQNLSHFYYSDDDGISWHFLSALYPCFWPKLFLYQKKLFIICTATEFGNLQIYNSDDGGVTWSQPAVILGGEGCFNIPGPQRNPTPIIFFKERLWFAFEFGSWAMPWKFKSGICSIACDKDPMIPKNWIVTPFTGYDPGFSGAVKGGNPDFIEGNVVITPENNLVNILRYDTFGSEPDYGKAIMLQIDADNPETSQKFKKVIDFPGSLSKFEILYDSETKMYVSLVNRVTRPDRWQRNILSLSISADLFNWKVVRDLINYEDFNWPEGFRLTAFQYADFFIENGNIYYACRTSIGGAHCLHDSNRISFHKLKNFRQFIK